MKSPFPGMDPYLEPHWRDIHHRFLTYACDDLQSQLPRELRARLEERVCVEPEDGPDRNIYPDVQVIERPVRGGGGGTAVLDEVDLAEPIIVRTRHETRTEGYIEIIDAQSGGRVVTVIELLSDTNKFPGDGQNQYRRKQEECRTAGVSLVEIDLLRSGDHVIAAPRHEIPKPYRTTYRVCVSRGWKPFEFELYPVTLRQRLPAIRIPLRQTDTDVKLDLQSVLDRCYHNGRYDDLDYRAGLEPPLSREDTAWADELLKQRGMR